MTIVQIEMFDDVSGNYDVEIYYVFRSKKSGLYFGYDGFDTDFYKGISPCIKQRELIKNLNSRLISKTWSEISEMLLKKNGAEWKQLGSIDDLDIIKLEINADGEVHEPISLVNSLLQEEASSDFNDEPGW